MKKENKIVYEIFINNNQFTCILSENKNNEIEKNIPSIIDIPDLEFIEKKKNLDTIKIYYKVKDLLKIKIYLDGKQVLENNFPLSISLRRLRQLLLTKLGDNFCFIYNGSLIRRKEEKYFSLRYAIKNDVLFLTSDTEFLFFVEEEDLKNKENRNCETDEIKNNNNIFQEKISKSKYSYEINSNNKDNNVSYNKNKNIIEDSKDEIINDNQNKNIIGDHKNEIINDNKCKNIIGDSKNEIINDNKNIIGDNKKEIINDNKNIVGDNKKEIINDNKNIIGDNKNEINDDNKCKNIIGDSKNEIINDNKYKNILESKNDIINDNKNKIISDNNKHIIIKDNCLINDNENIKITNENKDEKINENNYKSKNKYNEKLNNENNNLINIYNSKDQKENESEYEILNNDKEICKINLSPEMTLTDLREKISKFIPRRTIFLKNKEKIEPSKEDSIIIRNIATKKSIFIETPKEDKVETMEIEIYLNEKIYIKKHFYLSIKIKSFRNNLKFDQNCKIIFKGKPLTIEEENSMTLDELCYKELKVSFFKIKDNDENITLLNNNKRFRNRNIILEKRFYKDSFNSNDNFETWVLLGKEKNGKTTFINCLLNYCLGVKFDDKFRYIVKENNKNGYGIYDINGNSISSKIRIIEFSGFTSMKNEDAKITEKILNFIKTVDKVKIICFVISGNQTRLTDDLKIIFSTVLNLFGYDIINNFIFLFTNCDIKEPPVLNCIRNSNFSEILPDLAKPWFFKFNNSYLFETIQNEFWNLGNSNYNELLNNLKERENTSLEITKKLINLKNSYKENKNNFITLIFQLQSLKEYINMLININYYADTNNYIPFETLVKYQECSKCHRIINNNYCENNCHYYQILLKENKRNQISFKELKYNKNYYNKCYNMYVDNYRNTFVDTAILYEQLQEYYELQLIKNDTLKNDLKESIDEYKKEDRKKLNNAIKFQENLYNMFKNGNNKISYRNFIISLNFEYIFNN